MTGGSHNSGARRWPFDFELIDKGHNITPEECQKLINVPPSDRRYALKLLRLHGVLDAGLRRAGKRCTVVVRGDGLRVLTDEEAAAYQNDAFLGALNKASRAARKQADVDMSQLTDAQRLEHERNLLENSLVMQAMRTKRRQLREERSPRMILPHVQDEGRTDVG